MHGTRTRALHDRWLGLRVALPFDGGGRFALRAQGNCSLTGTAKDGGLISRAVREALGTLVSPQICEQLIKRSLIAQGLPAIPETGMQIGEWLEAGLRPEVETVVGPDAADLIMMELGPIAAYAAISRPKQAPTAAAAPTPRSRSARPPPTEQASFPSDEPDRATDLRVNPDDIDWTAFKMPAAPQATSAHDDFLFDSSPPTGPVQAYDSNPDMSAPTFPPSHAVSSDASPANDVALYTARPQAPDFDPLSSHTPAAVPTLLAATSDMGNLEGLRRFLGGSACVVHIPDLVGMLDALDEPGITEPIVLIDCQRPTVHAKSVAALGEDLPRGTTVVLWGADESTWQQIDRERTPGCRWVRCSREASTSDVGSLCAMLIG